MLQIIWFGVLVSSHPGHPHDICASCGVPALCPILPPGAAGSAACDRGTRQHHSRGFIYRYSRFDLAMTPALCPGAHGYGWEGPVLSTPVTYSSLCYLRDGGFTGEEQSLHLNVHHSFLLRAASSWPSVLPDCSMKHQGGDIRVPTTERAKLLFHLPTYKAG